MGDYLNPGNKKFHDYVKDDIYVDKTGLIAYTNSHISKSGKFMCVTRPRRFGKSYIADMLTAYYSRGCDSHTFFDNLKIAEEDSYKNHLNKYNVIYFDVSQIISKDVDAKTGLSELENDLVHELGKEHRFMSFRKKKLIPMLNKVCKKTHKGFIFIIDEWDCPFRERKNDSESQELY
ncbi:MAG: AAA family ATPase, partial [Clostridia bacterium]|nr:AAA family ATPase [Clostridia bacterium]